MIRRAARQRCARIPAGADPQKSGLAHEKGRSKSPHSNLSGQSRNALAAARVFARFDPLETIAASSMRSLAGAIARNRQAPGMSKRPAPAQAAAHRTTD